LIKKHKWFFSTLSLWCLLSALGAWALIYSPFIPTRKSLGDFAARINGVTARGSLYATDLAARPAVTRIMTDWNKEGWKETGGNLAPVLLALPRNLDSSLSEILQVRIFHNRRLAAFRALALLTDANRGQTYEWVAEIPQKALQSPDPHSVDFPLNPSANAADIRQITVEKMAILYWVQPPGLDPTGFFQRLYASQGFSGRIYSREKFGATFILRRGSLKLFAMVQETADKSTIIICKMSES